MIRKITFVAIALLASGCATWTPEQRQAFSENMAKGLNAWNQGWQQGVQQSQQNQYRSNNIHCSSRKSYDGKTIETDCY